MPRKPGVKSARFTSRWGATAAVPLHGPERAVTSRVWPCSACSRSSSVTPGKRDSPTPSPHTPSGTRARSTLSIFSLEYVADLLGYRSLRSTQVYARITSPAREQMLRQLAQSCFVVRWI